METIRVHSDFHTAHRQVGYPGKCKHVHGHTWKGTIVVSTERFPRNALDMAIDFGDLKDVFRRLDHKILVSASDQAFLDNTDIDPKGVVVVPGSNPSVENVAHYCLQGVVDVIRDQYPARGIAYRIEVTVQETDNNIFIVDGTPTI